MIGSACVKQVGVDGFRWLWPGKTRQCEGVITRTEQSAGNSEHDPFTSRDHRRLKVLLVPESLTIRVTQRNPVGRVIIIE